MAKEKPIVDRECLLRKFDGKGGWTYAEIPEIRQNPDKPFGWVTVKGSIDGYQLSHYKLMPMGDGKLFLPVKAAIRKKIRKEAGDKVHIILDIDNTPVEIPDEIMACFENEPKQLYTEFTSRTSSEQKAFLDWICAARGEYTRANRIIAMMDKLARKLSFHKDETSSHDVGR